MFTCPGGNQGTFSPELGGTWNVMTPMVLGTFPAVARFVRRMDVDQSDRTATMNVCMRSLREGKLSVDFKSEEHHDIKSYSSEQIPNRALTATRVAVKVTESYEETPTFDFAPYMDGSTYVSDTKQLRWTPARDGQLRTGYFTINTPGTRGFCGFADGSPYSDMMRWVQAGAVNQYSTDAYIGEGVTHARRFLDYAKTRGNLVINRHWAWAPHAHLVMAYDDSICPNAEFPMTEDIPKSHLDGPHLLAPDWPGFYHLD